MLFYWQEIIQELLLEGNQFNKSKFSLKKRGVGV